jgi:HEAT repeat protein
MKSTIKALIDNLSSDNGIIRQKARYELIDIGKPVIEYLVGLQYLSNIHLRWEAIKTLSQIADPDSIPILINALENNHFDVRWLAAEGLIEIGKESIKPLLEAIVTNQDSIFMREGVHHVLKGLKAAKLFNDKHKIIEQLENPNAESTLAFTAKHILESGY